MPNFNGPSFAGLRPVVNPLGAAHCWAWLARVLNQKPRKITATLLLAMLKPTSHMLADKYPKQFKKLLRFIEKNYLEQIKAKLVEWGNDAAEEKVSEALLRAYVTETLDDLRGLGKLEPPVETNMDEIKPPDDLSNAGGDYDN